MLRRCISLMSLLCVPGMLGAQCPSPVISAPYTVPVVSTPYVDNHYEHEKVIVKEVTFATPVPFALFSFSAPPTTPPPVLVASPPAPAAAAAPAGTVCQADARLARLEAAVLKLAENRVQAVQTQATPPPVAVLQDAPPLAQEMGQQSTVVAAEAPLPPPAGVVVKVGKGAAEKSVAIRTEYPGELGPAVNVLAQNRCAQCHTGENARGDVMLWNDAGEWQPTSSWREIVEAVTPHKGPNGQLRAAKMPKGSPVRLSEAEIEFLKRMRDAKK